MSDMQMSIDPAWAWAPFEPQVNQPWDLRRAAHLFRRAGCGAAPSTLKTALAKSPAEVVDELVASNSEKSQFRNVADRLAKTVIAGGDPKQLSAAWVYRLMRTPTQLLEKATLFWHGHFATSAEKVEDADAMWAQNQLLRDHALGDFSKLVHGVAQDPAMLIYLDSATNRKAHPNENFARELMELFCLGEGNYTERDVLELARCFTGWEIKRGKFRMNKYQHDTGAKSVLGRKVSSGEDAIDIVLENSSTEIFLARKWYRYFIADEPVPSEALLKPLAEEFRQHNLQIAPTLKTLLRSNLFFSDHAMARKVKGPVEYVIGMLRSLEATTNTTLIAEGLVLTGQGLFYPPNVKGWDGGRSWINSSTLLGRANLIQSILENEATKFGGTSLSEYLDSLGLRSSQAAIDHFAQMLLAVPIPAATRHQLNQTYSFDSKDREQQTRGLLHAIMTLPECQLG